jgi:predicted TIM-barrel fold metal-dependent hydrolase
MHTPWGEVAVADAHVHFFSHNYYSLLARQKGPPETAETICAALGFPAPPQEPRDLAEKWVVELDGHGVERACLIASLPGDETSVAAAVSAYPSRFTGFFFFNPLLPDVQYRLRTAFESGLRGVCLLPSMHGYSVAEERCRAVFEMAAATPGAVVFVHCGVLSIGLRRRLGIPSHFDMRYANPLDVHAVAARFEELPFIIPHFGAGMFREALMVCGLCPNVYLDTSSSNSWTRYHTPALTLEHAFDRALDIAGPSRLLFGTDSSHFPRGWHAEIFWRQVTAVEGLGVGADIAAGIFGGNLRRLLGILPRASA